MEKAAPEAQLVVVAAAFAWLGGLVLFGFDAARMLADDAVVTLLLLVALAGAAGVLARATRAWYALAGFGAAGVPFLVLVLYGGATRLTDPVGPPFLGVLALLAALLLAAPAAWRGARGGAVRRWRHAPRLGVYAVAVLAVVGGMGLAGALATRTVPAREAGDPVDFDPREAAQDRRVLVMASFRFDPVEVSLRPGIVTELVVENRDAAFHTLTYVRNGTEYHHDFGGGVTRSVFVLFEEPGVVAFRCVPHSDGYADDPERSMVGRFVVEPS